MNPLHARPPLLDPRKGDLEDDASSTKQRSLLSLAGSLLAEVSLPKLAAAWVVLIGLPGLLLGFLPLLASLWLGKLSANLPLVLTGLGSAILVVLLLAAAWFGGRPVLRLLENSFWSLHALGIQPGYVLGRETIRHVAEKRFNPSGSPRARGWIRSISAIVSALVLSLFAAWIAYLAWPATRWTATFADLAQPLRLIWPAIANAVVIVSAYFCGASLLWGLADAHMPPPLDLKAFPPAEAGRKSWRVAHLSDIHTVAGPYGFRIESGRAGPRGNQRLAQAFRRLSEIHGQQPLDVILISGDLTDAGSATEWAEFFDLLAPYPELRKLVVGLPGNHDLNVVDRANPARLDLPGSPLKRLRQMRMLSALGALQGDRMQVFDTAMHKPGVTLAEYLEPHRTEIVDFADKGRRRLSRRLAEIADAAFPMVMPPATEDGFGMIVLDSNAATHFSFTNALGMISIPQARAIEAIAALYPKACWVIGLHHHLVEYPHPAHALSERIGTALINGSYAVRRLQRLGGRALLMHGHRHTEWIGTVGNLIIVSAPSPVMDATDAQETHFFIHTVQQQADGRIALLTPETIRLGGVVLDSGLSPDH